MDFKFFSYVSPMFYNMIFTFLKIGRWHSLCKWKKNQKQKKESKVYFWPLKFGNFFFFSILAIHI